MLLLHVDSLPPHPPLFKFKKLVRFATFLKENIQVSGSTDSSTPRTEPLSRNVLETVDRRIKSGVPWIWEFQIYTQNKFTSFTASSMSAEFLACEKVFNYSFTFISWITVRQELNPTSIFATHIKFKRTALVKQLNLRSHGLLDIYLLSSEKVR